MREIIDSIKEEIGSREYSESRKVVFSNPNYTSVPFSNDNFSPILDGVDSESSIAFVDGGNSVIFESANQCLQLIRVYYCIYQSGKKIKSEKLEFFCLTNSFNVRGNILFKTKIFPIGNLDSSYYPEEIDLNFNSMDESLKNGRSRAKISQIGGCARRFTELLVAKRACEFMGEGDAVVLDGILQTSITNEEKYMNELYKFAESRRILVSGLAKTTRLFTDSGEDGLIAINKMAGSNLGSWVYYPVAEIKDESHKAEIYIVKLNSKSKYCFRFETNLKLERDHPIFSLLASLSKDGVFLGYPYGLIDADMGARISNEEKNYLRTIFGDNPELESSLSAHSKLDSVSF